MIISLIVAMDRIGLIGSQGKIPWNLPQELQYFKRITMGKPVIMGRKTFESIGKPLTGRKNIVVTTQEDWEFDDVFVAKSLESAYRLASKNLNKNQEIMVIGGANIYAQSMQVAQKLYLTIIDHEFEGDAWLQGYDRNDWNLVSSERVNATAKNPYPYDYNVLLRKSVGKTHD